jgi:6-pyruvoyltetrahydropterin/6-carboxytetrahydropterin synthase
MFTINVKTGFQASHQLILTDGSKEPLHSHNWVASASVGSETLNDIGIVMDFHQLKSALDKITSEFNNMSLNKIDYFRRNNPTAENVAKYIYQKLELALLKGPELRSIKVEEETGFFAEFGKIPL